MLQANDKIRIRMIDRPGGREIFTRNYGKFFTVIQHPQTGQLCVEWGQPPYGDSPLLPLSAFAPSVIFENVNTGAQFRWDTTVDCLVEV